MVYMNDQSNSDPYFEHWTSHTIGALSLIDTIGTVTLLDELKLPSLIVYCMILGVVFGSAASFTYLQQ